MDNAPPNIPKRIHKHQQPDDNSSTSVTPDLRDSGISTASLSELTGAFTNMTYEDNNSASVGYYTSDSLDFSKTSDLNGSFAYNDAINPSFKLDPFLNIKPNSEEDMDDGPPPIPPKIGAMERSENGLVIDNYTMSRSKIQENESEAI